MSATSASSFTASATELLMFPASSVLMSLVCMVSTPIHRMQTSVLCSDRGAVVALWLAHKLFIYAPMLLYLKLFSLSEL